MIDRYGIPVTHSNNIIRQPSSQRAVSRRASVGEYGNRVTHDDDSNHQPSSIASPPGISRRASTSMTESEQRERRSSIKAIMADKDLSPKERRLSIQGIMDGRRRSSVGTSHVNLSSTKFATSCCINGSRNESDQCRGSCTGRNNNTSIRQDHIVQQDSLSNGSNTCVEITEAQRQQEKAAALAISTRMERNRPPCTHYERSCSIIAPCCGLAFGCRICHDECPMLPPPLLSEQHKTEHQEKMRIYQRSSSMPSSFSSLPEPQDQSHKIDRFNIQEVICKNCYTRQSSKTNHCIECNTKFGEYHCSTCNLWMSAEKEPYHCKDCGFCRVGGEGNFRHCHDCGMCVDSLLFDQHSCKVGTFLSDCPVCQEDLFSSRSASHELPCGHAIHWHCFRELANYDSRCPLCKKTAQTPEKMASTWSAMAMGVMLQPVPPNLAKVVDISCIDCESKEEHRKWHFLGVQCRRCSSFNTIVEGITLVGPEAATFLREHGDGEDMSQRGINEGHGNYVARTAFAHQYNRSASVAMGYAGGQPDPFDLGDSSTDDDNSDAEMEDYIM